MNNLVQASTDRAVMRAIVEDEQANTNYHKLLRRFTSGNMSISGEEAQPAARLDAAGLREIDTVWLSLQATGKNLRSAYMKLYVASL
jgi:hypothetical protein